MDILIEWGFVGVFIACFLAATVLPFSSEVVLTGVLLAGADYWICIAAATIGNTLGGMTCYLLGYLGKVEWLERYLGMPREKVERWQQWLHNKGSWVAFFVFLPGVGDFIAVAMGYMRANLWGVTISMALGKLARYIGWMYGVYWAADLPWAQWFT